MYTERDLNLPLFEIGLKGYMYGKSALELAKAVDNISRKYGVEIVFDPQYVDIPMISQETSNILIFSQHMDAINIGRGQGRVLPEAIKEAGAVGTLLNHVECRLTLSEIHQAIKRADEVGLITMVCVDDIDEAIAVATFNPNIIVLEPPELIGSGKTVVQQQEEFIPEAVQTIKKINSKIVVFIGGGVSAADDVAQIIRLGAEGTGSTSGIVCAENPVAKTEEMVKALKEAWIETHH